MTMCGIVGVFSSDGRLPDPMQFARCLDKLKNRGPDDGGVWSDSLVKLGHRRLSVVELSGAGHQPMHSHDGRYVIVFNGEIYNHLELRKDLDPEGGWRGQSDTETLVEAFRHWGSECLGRLNGMFAFAIWDRKERRLFLARDRMGVKPLYYSNCDGVFAFGSRPGAVVPLAGPTAHELNPEALRLYLELGYIPAPLSYYRNVNKLRPGHFAWVDLSGVRISRYWDFRHIAPDGALLRRPDRPERKNDSRRDENALRLRQDRCREERAGEGRPVERRGCEGAHRRQDVLRVKIAEDTGVEERRRVQPVRAGGDARDGDIDTCADECEQQQRKGDLRHESRQLDERVERRRVGKMPPRPDPIRVAGSAELVEGEGRIIDRRRGAGELQLPPLQGLTPDAVHRADAVTRGVVAPDFPDRDVAGAGPGQRDRANQEACEQKRDELSV